MKTKTKTKLKTSHGWATELKHDRANMARLLSGVKPDGRRGRYAVFSASTIKAALARNQQRKRVHHDLTDALLMEKVRSLELRNQIADGTLVLRAKADSLIQRSLTETVNYIHRKLVDELPSECAGLDVEQIRIKARKLKGEAMERLRTMLRELETLR